ncbi:hypothetical protein TBLA_0A02510 [Henningerozyma blattae CBS 6284]|uniref:Importin N-terminal domain-containing protein n=1 Tax=Henningerozyma blattae (strain ATCC 34711 / CBS 6284 / DSM 70876 / NBRC 10599 / NRRL Y-10934 / UCD 77-7) TaxID=1071380 RepID=I2GV98_HENB6|nr:hypothetical protein TBLA_0A02510 [Tetrapisispora blattae CBS 6284]CCH58050.1 hypothetical protein TBLA_0A02510 [Tetrapisispora blattae CBS 6284]
MSNEDAILACIEQTMVADAKLIREAENQLNEYQKQDGFTTFLLNVIGNEAISANIRLSSAIYMKNKLQRCWGSKREAGIKSEEQQAIKQKLVEVLVKVIDNNHLRPALTESVRAILNNNDPWNLTGVINELLKSGEQQYTYAGLLLLFEVCIAHRWDMSDNRSEIDEVISQVFPTIEGIASQLVNREDYKSNELLYLILKCFKYACLNNFPAYFKDINKVNAWIEMHLFVCAKQFPKEVLDLEPADRSLDKRVKVNKWGFGNLYKFISKYSRTTKAISEEFNSYVISNLTPVIIQQYFKIIQSWKEGTLWLSEASLFYLIEFFEKCLVEDSLYQHIEPHIQIIIENIIFSCVCATKESMELLEDDPEEYTRRYFDLNKEGSTSDVASTDFIYVIGHKRPEKLNSILPFVSEILQSYSTNSDNLECAFKQEGALRMISSLFTQLDENTELEAIFSNFIVPLLSQNNYQFLLARSLETIAQYTKKFEDMGTLSKIFELTYNHFMNSDVLPVRVEAADALKTLIIANPDIHSHISSQVPGITEKLLMLSKEFELDTLSEVIETFVEHFADELTPFAENLASSLVEQFLTLGNSILENSSSSYNAAEQDQEIQACALLQTMTTMVMSMTKVSLIDKFVPVVKFVIINAQISLLSEIVDLMDSLALSAQALFNQFTPTIWEIVHDVLDSFETYAMDYFESYLVFFETLVTYGFPKDQTFAEPFLTILSAKLESEIDYDVESVLDILVFYTLSMNDIPLFSKAIKAASVEELEIEDSQIIKLFLASLSVKPLETFQICESEGFTLALLTKWFDNKFASVFSTKLQILAILSVMKLPELPGSVIGYISQLSNKLVQLTEELPTAIRRRDAMAQGAEGLQEIFDNANADDDAFFEEYEDDLKETVLDDVNAFQEVANFFTQLQSVNPTRYQQVIGSLSEEKKNSLETIIEFVSTN